MSRQNLPLPSIELCITFLVMLGLKLWGPMENVSWWLVTCPLWMGYALLALLMLLFLVVTALSLIWK